MTITVAHTKGGVGKSTLAWHLAHALKEIGKSVTLVDLDFQQTLYFVNQIRDLGDIAVLQPQTVEDVMQLLIGSEHRSDYYIVDVGGFDSDINRAALEFSHKVVIPISESVTEVLGFKTFESIINELVLQDTEFNIVLNNVHPLTRNFSIIKEAIGENYKLLNTVIRSRKVYKTTLGVGSSVFDTNNERAKEEIRGIRDELICN
jgi:chromosome partitioning protein